MMSDLNVWRYSTASRHAFTTSCAAHAVNTRGGGTLERNQLVWCALCLFIRFFDRVMTWKLPHKMGTGTTALGWFARFLEPGPFRYTMLNYRSHATG